MGSKRIGITTTVAAITIIVALIIGGVIGYLAKPPEVVEKIVEKPSRPTLRTKR